MMHWYAAYTKSRFEKKVHSLLSEKSIEAYVPLQKQLRQWKDRKKWVEEPLIRSYVFVRITEKEHFHVLNTPGVVCFVTFSGKAAPIRNSEIEILKKIMATETEIELTSDELQLGDPVEIIAGKLMGITGELMEYKGNKKVVIKIDHIGYSLILNIPTIYLRKRLHNLSNA
jgi:transcriptional antiterminator RfaH